MELDKAIDLIRGANLNSKTQTVWADLGSGSGLFTRALASLLKPHSKIFAVDKNKESLKDLKLSEQHKAIIEKISGDFIYDDLNVKNLDGIMMANSFHFVLDKISFINKMKKYLKTNACFLFVEYDTDLVNPWVPYPISYSSLELFFQNQGYKNIKKLNQLSSRYNRSTIYSALIIP